MGNIYVTVAPAEAAQERWADYEARRKGEEAG